MIRVPGVEAEPKYDTIVKLFHCRNFNRNLHQYAMGDGFALLPIAVLKQLVG